MGGEHGRVTRAERKLEELTDTYSRLDKESKTLRDQLLHQRQHTSMQIEEIIESIQVESPYSSISHETQHV